MVRDFVLSVDRQGRHVHVRWDVTVTGSGSVQVDGTPALAWQYALRWPGVRRTIRISGHPVSFTYTFFSFDIDLSDDPSVQCLQPQLPPGYRPSTGKYVTIMLSTVLITLAVAVGGAILVALSVMR